MDNIISEYKNTYYRKIKMNSIKVEDNTYIDSIKEFNDKDLKFKVGDLVRISKYKNISLKDILQIGMKKFLWLKKLKILFHGDILVMSQLSLISHIISKVKKLLEHCMKKNYEKEISKGLG